jgi:hypothetical protein
MLRRRISLSMRYVSKTKYCDYAVVELPCRSIRYGRENIARPSSFMYNVSTGRRTHHTCMI